MTNILNTIKSIQDTKENVKERIHKFFEPLKSRYVTIEESIEYKPIKILGIFPGKQEYTMIYYEPLKFFFWINKGDVEICICSEGNCKSVVGTFSIDLFYKSDEEISESPSMIEFIERFLNSAIPKWEKYSKLFKPYDNQELNFFIADKLESYFTKEELELIIKNVDNFSIVAKDDVVTLISTWVNEFCEDKLNKSK